MTLNPIVTAELVTREVRTGSRDGVPTKIVVARRTYATDRADLWDAVTNAERLPRWFLPISGDLQVGGRYQFEGNAGGIVESCEPTERFAVTWQMGEQVSWLRIALTPTSDGTVLELAHEAAMADRTFWDMYGPGAVGIGWDLGLVGLGLHVAGAGPLNETPADDWAITPDGTAFVRHAAANWARAAIADGDEPDAATEAAERTVAFYTVPPESA